jgi:WXG100 family type VII secretion target
MSNAKVDLDPAQLRDMAIKIRKCQSDTEANLTEATAEMNKVFAEGWRSAAGDRLRDRFESLRNRYFQKYPEAMGGYAKFLDDTATEYENADERRKNEIAAMMNMGQ